MGLLDKLKNLFTDEEEIIEEEEIDVEDAEEEEVEENKLPTFMREKIEREEKQINILEEKAREEEKELSDRNLASNNNSFKFPIAFEDKDFEIGSYSDQNVIKKEKTIEVKKTVSELYTKKSDNKKDKKPAFKATPIISPVYGILDKNYKKEEVKAKKESDYEIKRPSKKIDFETVRMKAFGTLSDEITDNLVLDSFNSIKEASEVEVCPDEDLLSDMISEDKKGETIATAEENYFDFGVEYEANKDRENEKNEVKIVNHNDEEVTSEKIEVKESNNKKENDNNNDVELTDDLFNLIDSMYEERDDL